MFREAAFSHVKKNLLFFLLLVSGLTANCRTAIDAPKANQTMREYKNENGLTVKLPENLTARPQSGGFVIEPSDGSNKNVRFPVEISVAFRRETPPSANKFPKEKIVGGKTVNYNIEEAEGGSGGTEYFFKAFEPVNGGYIFYETAERGEYSEPGFNVIWQIIENTSVK